MKLSAKSAIAALVTIAGITSVTAQENIPSSSLPAPKVTFGPTGVKTSVGELKAGPAYGDLSKGRHGTFIRMPAKFVSPLHTHTSDYFGRQRRHSAARGLLLVPEGQGEACHEMPVGYGLPVLHLPARQVRLHTGQLSLAARGRVEASMGCVLNRGALVRVL